MKLHIKIKFGFALMLFGLLFAIPVHAATLDLSLEKEIISNKEDIAVLIALDSEAQEVNTAQAVITFPSNLLEVTKIDLSNSVFSFWLEQPSYDNGKGTIRFVGGSVSGFTGSGLKIMRVSFKVKGSGTGRLGITDGAITSTDGVGSNVYNTAKGLDINIPATAQFQAVTLERNQQQATLAKELPNKLGLNVSFYPDPTKWNSHSASFQAKWNIGSDTTKAAISLDKNPNSIPLASAEALTGSKVFPALDDGIWYIHLRVANNIGWSGTLHYRLAVDTTPPKSFKISSNDSFKTINSKPTINFVASDLTSGIYNYIIYLDKELITTTKETSFKFSPLLPGVHQLVVVAVDNAGNATSQAETLEILPIESPTIEYINHRVYTEEGEIGAGGTALSGEEVIVQIQNSQEQIVFEKVVSVDSNGNWNIAISNSLSLGDYYLLVTARDKNMASSFPVASDIINVIRKPLFFLGTWAVTEFWFFVTLIFLLIASFGAGWFSYHKWRGQLNKRVVVTERELVNILENLKKDVEKLLKDSDVSPD